MKPLSPTSASAGLLNYLMRPSNGYPYGEEDDEDGTNAATTGGVGGSVRTETTALSSSVSLVMGNLSAAGGDVVMGDQIVGNHLVHDFCSRTLSIGGT